jgi:hypothetical protein
MNISIEMLTETRIRQEILEKQRKERIFKAKNSSPIMVDIQWTPELRSVALKYYSKYLPGYVAKEEIKSNYTFVVYRIQAENLRTIVSQMPPPFKVRVKDEVIYR